MYTTKVNVNDLVIDMPLDEANVAQKMESLKSGGLVQPVTVWLKDFRIIDGFHRTEAAKRLGWMEIDCVVKDCDEETFWDARIQSARQHHKISGERFVVWIKECWQATDWAIEFLGATDVAMSIANTIWKILPDARYQNNEVSELHKSIYNWFDAKARLWNMTFTDLQLLIFDSIKGNLEFHIPHFNDFQLAVMDITAKEANLTLDQRLALRQILPEGRMAKASNWLANFAATNTIPGISTATDKDIKETRSRLFDYAKQQEQEELSKITEQEMLKQAERERKRKDEEKAEADRKQQWEKSPEGKQARRKLLHNDFSMRVSALRAYVADHCTDIAQFDDGYEMLMSMSAWAANKADELFPEREQPTELQLRRELADAYKQIESLQKALDSRKGYTPKLPQVMAYSSTQISKS